MTERDSAAESWQNAMGVVDKIVTDSKPSYHADPALQESWGEMRDAYRTGVDTVTASAAKAAQAVNDDTIPIEGRHRQFTAGINEAESHLAETNRHLATAATVYRAHLATEAVGTVDRRRTAEVKEDARDMLATATNDTDLVDAAQTLAESSDDLAALAGSGWMDRYLTARGVDPAAVDDIRQRAIRRNATNHSEASVREAADTYMNSGKLGQLAGVQRSIGKYAIDQAYRAKPVAHLEPTRRTDRVGRS